MGLLQSESVWRPSSLLGCSSAGGWYYIHRRRKGRLVTGQRYLARYTSGMADHWGTIPEKYSQEFSIFGERYPRLWHWEQGVGRRRKGIA